MSLIKENKTKKVMFWVTPTDHKIIRGLVAKYNLSIATLLTKFLLHVAANVKEYPLGAPEHYWDSLEKKLDSTLTRFEQLEGYEIDSKKWGR